MQRPQDRGNCFGGEGKKTSVTRVWSMGSLTAQSQRGVRGQIVQKVGQGIKHECCSENSNKLVKS